MPNLIRIKSTGSPGSPGSSGADNYMARLVKLVPAEVIAIYLTFKSIMDGTGQPFVWGLICLILVIIVRTFGTHQPGKSPQYLAVLVAVISFILWVCAMGGTILPPQLGISSLSPQIWSVAIGVWTFLVPYFYKGD